MRLAHLTTLLTLLLAGSAWAQSTPPSPPPSVLDNALDDKTPATTTPATQPAGTAPDKSEVIDPNAARAVDSEDLVRKLTGENGDNSGAAGPDSMLTEVVERMADSAKRLQEQDPGAITQETQRRIILNLDSLIALAQKQQQGGGGGGSKPRPGDKRQQNPGNNSGKGPHNPGGSNPATESQLPGGSSDPAQSNGQDIHEKSQEWGHLPERDRDLIINGVKEEPLPAYRQAVQQYYKALADLNKATRDN